MCFINTNDEALIVKADEFLNKLKELVKHYAPEDFAYYATAILDKSLDDFHEKKKIIPNFYILHAIESNCRYYELCRNEILTEAKFSEIIDHYIRYYDPVAEYLLEVEEDGIIPFFINMARQQFYVNRTYGYDDLGRAILIFTSTSLNKSSKVFESKFGIGFSEWMLICFSVFASSTKGVPPRIRIEYYLDSDKKIAENESIRNVFKLLSIEPRYVSQACIEKISKINNSLAMQFDVYIESIFYDKPMLKLDESRYLVVHKHFLLRQATEGIYDLMKSITSGGTFGNEFGKAFEGYVSTLLSTFLSKDHIYTENDLIRYSNSKVWDFLLEFDDSIVLVECKGTEFNSIIATENAMRKDNSTRAFSKAFKQLNSIENLYKSGVFSDLVSGDKTVVKIILTYKQLYFANSSWYRKNILDYQRIDVEDNCYPEIMSIMEFEKFLYYMKETKLSPIQILNYRLENKYDGDWSSILNNVKIDLPLLRDSFNEFTVRMISNSR